MRDTDLFQIALGLTPPWQVSSAEFKVEEKRVDIAIDFPRGSTFVCSECGMGGLKAYDTVEKIWRHLNFFQHETYLTARMPRVDCPKCGVRLVDEIPWARRDSGFTLLFEAMLMVLVKAMPVKSVAEFVGEHDTRIWRVLHHYVDKGRAEAKDVDVRRVGVDETSSKKGHNYVSLFVDIDESRVLYATEGKDAETVKRFQEDLVAHGGTVEKIEEFCSDMSPAFIKGVEDNFPNACLTFDRFHIMKVINEAVDEVRRQEQKERPELVKTRFIWLKNQDNLTTYQQAVLEDLQMGKFNLKTMRAYHIRLNFQEFFELPPKEAEAFLKKWYYWATHSRLEPIIEAAYTIKRHWEGVLRWSYTRISNGILEGFNSLVQAAKARARGYRTTHNLIAMIYLIGGKLNFGLPI